MSTTYSEINKKIIKKIESLTKNKSEISVCLEMIQFEIRNPSESENEFKERYKSILNKFFPYEDKK
jgi:hypothetical protein